MLPSRRTRLSRRVSPHCRYPCRGSSLKSTTRCADLSDSAPFDGLVRPPHSFACFASSLTLPVATAPSLPAKLFTWLISHRSLPPAFRSSSAMSRTADGARGPMHADAVRTARSRLSLARDELVIFTRRFEEWDLLTTCAPLSSALLCFLLSFVLRLASRPSASTRHVRQSLPRPRRCRLSPRYDFGRSSRFLLRWTLARRTCARDERRI